MKKKNTKIREKTLIFEASLNAVVQPVNLVLLILSDERSLVQIIDGNAAEARLGFGSLSFLTETHTLAVFGTLGGEILI